MSEMVHLDKFVLEAKPFWPDKPFINPDKALIRAELPMKENYHAFIKIINYSVEIDSLCAMRSFPNKFILDLSI
jgi:hypothetical protein